MRWGFKDVNRSYYIKKDGEFHESGLLQLDFLKAKEITLAILEIDFSRHFLVMSGRTLSLKTRPTRSVTSTCF